MRVIILLFFATLLSFNTAFAQTKVVVVPLGGDDFAPLENIITVAKGEGDFTDIQAAINSVSDASASNPYLIVIGPGTYDVSSSILVKEYVHIQGSGKNITILSGGFSGGLDSGSIINVHSNTSISNLSINNISTTGTSATIGISIYETFIPHSNVLIDNVSIIASSSASDSSRGIYLETDENIVIKDTDITVDGATYNYGIRTYIGGARISGVTIIATNGTRNRGIYGRGVSSGLNVIENTTIEASGTASYAIYDGDHIIKHSTLSGGNGSVEATDTATADILFSIIDGAATGNVLCVLTTESDGDEHISNCTTGP